jgi:hypothetical protein
MCQRMAGVGPVSLVKRKITARNPRRNPAEFPESQIVAGGREFIALKKVSFMLLI